MAEGGREKVNPSILKSRFPFGELPEGVLEDLAAPVQVEVAQRGECVLERGSLDEHSVYLLKGAVELEAGDGRTLTVDGTSTRARQPLSRLTPHKYRIVALSDISYFRVDNGAIARLFAPVGEENFLLEEQEVSGVEASDNLFRSLFRDLASGHLALPVLPWVADRIEAELRDDKPDGAKLAAILLKDPAVTAHVVKVACSVSAGAERGSSSLAALVERLGGSSTRKSVLRMLTLQRFNPTSPLLMQRMAAVWRHSHQVAAICAALVEKCEGFSADKALIAGMLHDIGAIAMLGYVEREEQALSMAQVDAALRQLRGATGGLILKTWGCDPDLAAAAERAHEWPLPGEADSPYGDLVWVARLYADIDTEEPGQLAELHDLPVFARLGLTCPGRESIREILNKANVRLKEMSASMRAA
jgi:HD-like signal output (HDOD) protein